MGSQFNSVILIAAWAVAVSAADAAPPQAKPHEADSIVLSGCLIQSRADTTTADPKGVIYTLDVAETEPEKPAAPATSASGTAARAAAVAKTRYALSTEEAVDFAKHVGHHVELTGRVLERLQTGKAPSNTGKPPAAVATPKPLPGAAHRMFQVATLKMIAAKCP
jgi:hypothetical protein